MVKFIFIRSSNSLEGIYSRPVSNALTPPKAETLCGRVLGTDFDYSGRRILEKVISQKTMNTCLRLDE